jgi:AmpD protein
MSYTLKNGWLAEAKSVPSPNFGPRPDDGTLDLLVIHNISLPPGQYEGDCIERFFTNCLDLGEHEYFSQLRGMEVSAHLLIRRNGELIQFVSLDDRAWHAGQSCFEGRENCNDFSIGIELEGTDNEPYSNKQYSTLQSVTKALMREYPDINHNTIVGHNDIAPGRKTDPGPMFDWDRFLLSLTILGETT